MKSIVTAVALFAATPAFAHHNGYINPTTGQREYTDDRYEYRGWSGGWRSSRKCYETVSYTHLTLPTSDLV